MEKIEAYLGDITQLPFKVDAIVNAANRQLIPGGGVDGAINRAAGPKLGEAMKRNGGISTGTAVYTDAFDLNCDYVIHAVGPIYTTGTHHEAVLLKNAYRSVMEIAKELELTSIAIPALSTGVYGYPLKEACQIEVQTVWKFRPERINIYLIAFDEEVAKILKQEIAEL